MTKVWNRLSSTQKKMAMIVGIIASVTYLYPKIIHCGKEIIDIVRFHNQREVYERQIRMLVNYIEVDKGLSRAQMDKADTLEWYVDLVINGKLEKEIKVDIRINRSGDYKIFVDDGNVGVYATYMNHSRNAWEYYDFNNEHHITYKK
jgi:hypothetical protein